MLDVGDGGGGPTRTHLEFVSRLTDLEGVPRTRMSSPAEFFRALEADGPTGAQWVGELYFTEHRGTYTSQAATKRANRRSEFALRRAELWGSLAAATAGYAYPRDEMERLWKLVLFNQFHDIVSGVSIERVHAEAVASYGEAMKGCGEIQKAALKKLGTGEGLAIANSLPWERHALVRLPSDLNGLRYAADGAELPVQRAGDALWVEAKLTSCGWVAVEPIGDGESGAHAAAQVHTVADEAEGPSSNVRAGKNDGAPWILENEFLLAEVDGFGRVVRILDKESGLDLAAAPCNEFRLYKDVNAAYDAWDIAEGYENLELPLEDSAQVEISANGPLFASLLVSRRLGTASSLKQEIVLCRGQRRIDFRTEIDWREDHKLLKTVFPTTIHADGALHEIQFGHVRRPNHRSTRFDAERFEVCNHRWTALAEARRGVAILNDGKYGIGTRGGELSLTLLKAPFVPDMRADRGQHAFTYSFYFWDGPFEGSRVVRAGYEANEGPELLSGLAGSRSFLSVDDEAVIAETVKMAEDGSGDLVVRLYESLGSAARCRLRLDLSVSRAVSTDLLERGGTPLQVSFDGSDGSVIELDFRPFEIKTVRLTKSG